MYHRLHRVEISESRKTPEYRAHRKELRSKPAIKEQEQKYAKSYRQREYVKKKSNARSTEYSKREEVRPRIKTYYKEYREKNREKLREFSHVYWQKPETKQNDKKRRGTQHRKEWRRAYEKCRLENDPKYYVRHTLRTRLNAVFSYYVKNGIPASNRRQGKYVIKYLEIFEKIGPRPSKEHELEHIIPCAAFDLTKQEEIDKCFSPENLCWVLAKHNQIKNQYWINDGVVYKGKNQISPQNLSKSAAEILKVSI